MLNLASETRSHRFAIFIIGTDCEEYVRRECSINAVARHTEAGYDNPEIKRGKGKQGIVFFRLFGFMKLFSVWYFRYTKVLKVSM